MEIKNTRSLAVWCEVMWLNWRHYELRLVWGQDLGYSCLTSVQLSPAKNPGPGPVSGCSMGLAGASTGQGTHQHDDSRQANTLL